MVDAGRPADLQDGLGASEAAVTSASATADAVSVAAEKNEDSEVAEALEEAATQADLTIGRVGWLRSWIHRLFGRDGGRGDPGGLR